MSETTRTARVERVTKETSITVAVDLDGRGRSQIATGIGFLDHMLEQLSRHSLIDIDCKAEGDIDVTLHHTVEDTGNRDRRGGEPSPRRAARDPPLR